VTGFFVRPARPISVAFALLDPVESGLVTNLAGLAQGLQVHAGQVTHRGLAEDVKRPYRAYAEITAGMR